MAKRANVAALVGRLPDPDERGFMSNIDADVVEDVIGQLRRRTRRNLPALIDLLAPPGAGEDFKARYALHVWAVKLCQDNEQERRLFARTLASQLGGDRPKPVQEFLIQQLQVAGHEEAVAGLGKVLLDEALCDAAAMALVAIRQGAAEQLRAVLPQAKGRCRLVILQNLGALKDGHSIPAFKEAVHDEDREIRLAAMWGLANMGAEGAADMLLEAADKARGWERIKATKACLLLTENLAAAGKRAEARRIYAHLRETRRDSEAYVCEAAEDALSAMR
jgi:HEAT repeat protein